MKTPHPFHGYRFILLLSFYGVSETASSELMLRIFVIVLVYSYRFTRNSIALKIRAHLL